MVSTQKVTSDNFLNTSLFVKKEHWTLQVPTDLSLSHHPN